MPVYTVEKELQDTDVIELQTFGRFHLIQYFWLILPIIMVSMSNMNYVFIAAIPDYRCEVPECENLNKTVKIPEWWPQNVDPKCQRPVLSDELFKLNTTCSASSFVGVADCDDWIYESEQSIVSAFNLGCNAWEATLVGTLHNAGMMISMPIAGWLSDKIGRKPSVIICSIGGFIGLFKIFVKQFYAYVIIEFLESILASGLYSVGIIILLIEIGGETKRVTAGVIFAYAIYVGEVIYALFVIALKYWKYLIIIIYAPMIAFFSYFFLLKESPRWQMIRGRMPSVKSTFKSIARINKLNITDHDIDALSDEQIRTKFDVHLQKEKESLRVIFGSKEIVTRLVVSCICFFTSSFLYYGLVVNSVYLPGDKYMNFILTSVASFPGDLIAFYNLNKFGRKITLQVGYVLSATFLVAQSYSPESMIWLKILLFVVGKLGVVVCFTSTFTYAMELFPTSIRGSLLGWGNTIARAGGMLAPLTPLLVTTLHALPSILFATTALISAFAVTFTPETKHLPLFDTIAQVHAYKTNEEKTNENDYETNL